MTRFEAQLIDALIEYDPLMTHVEARDIIDREIEMTTHEDREHMVDHMETEYHYSKGFIHTLDPGDDR